MIASGEVVAPTAPLKRGKSFSKSLKTIFRSRSRTSSKTKSELLDTPNKRKSSPSSPVVGTGLDRTTRDASNSAVPTPIGISRRHDVKTTFILGSGSRTVSATPEPIPIPIPNHGNHHHHHHDDNIVTNNNRGSLKATSLPPIGTEFLSGMGEFPGNISDRGSSPTDLSNRSNRVSISYHSSIPRLAESTPQSVIWDLPKTVPIPELNEEEGSENVFVEQALDEQANSKDGVNKEKFYTSSFPPVMTTTHDYNKKSRKNSEDGIVEPSPTSVTLAATLQLNKNSNFKVDTGLDFLIPGGGTKQAPEFESDLDYSPHHHLHHTNRRGSHSHVDQAFLNERRSSIRTTHSRLSSNSRRRDSLTPDISPPLSPQISSEPVFRHGSAVGLESVRSNSSAVSFPHVRSSGPTKSNLRRQLSTKSAGSPVPSSQIHILKPGQIQVNTTMPYHGPNHHTPDDSAKCILNLENFKVYDNGTHEHNLKMIPLVRSEEKHVIDPGANTNSTHGVTKVSSGLFIFSGFFKSHPRGKDHTDGLNAKEKIEVDSKRFENAVSLIPSQMKELFTKGRKLDDIDNGVDGESVNRCYSVSSAGIEDYVDPIDRMPKKVRSSSSTSAKVIPRVVNPEACVSSDELELINIISGKILRGLALKVNHSEASGTNIKEKIRKGNQDMGSSTVTNGFTEKGEGGNKHKLEDSTLTSLYGNIIGIIGRGAYGTVSISSREVMEDDVDTVSCTYSRDNRIYFAVKELKPRKSDQMQKFSTKITSEFIIGHSLSRAHKPTDIVCPNMPKIFDIMGIDGTFVEVMELCPSGDLYSLLTQRSKNKGGVAFHPLEADCFMKQLLNGVKYMHDHGVAHCDIKPENILFHPNGLLKICDFGTSCVFQTAWERHVHYQTGVIGSEPYVAPEEFNKVCEYDPRLADCWSCGIVYCTMILGHYLWKIALSSKDAFYDSFIEELTDTKEFSLFEELRHVNHEINGYRKSALYKIIQPDPRKRITIDELLSSQWMKRTRCCISYRRGKRTL